MKFIYTILACLIFVSTQSVQAQNNQRHVKQVANEGRCLSYEYELEIRSQYPEMGTIEEFEARLAPVVAEYKEMIENGQRLSTINLPIVYHVIHNGTAIGTGSNISAAFINSQNEQLNFDYRMAAGTSGDNNDPRGADSQVEFCLATEDPDGNSLSEPGINRINRNDEGWSAPPYDQTDMNGTIKAASIWDPEKYVNVWIVELTGGLLGYAQFPSNTGLGGLSDNGGPANTDGVVITYNSVGSTTNPFPGGAPYDKGRTLTHELGHWLGLRHIWGDADCGTDFCDDTPTQMTSSGGNCPNTTTCDGMADMTKNYMDYSNDVCMNVVTNDQKARIRAVLATGRSALLSSDIPCNVSGYSPIISYFTASGQGQCPGSTVTFANRSFGAGIDYSWDFGDGTNSDLENPTKMYNGFGDFDVVLTISDGSQSDSYTRSINVADVQQFNNLNNGTIAAYASDESGFIGGHNNYNDAAKAEYFGSLTNGETLRSADFLFNVADGSPGTSVTFNIWDNSGTGGEPGSIVATKDLTIADINVDAFTRVDFDDLTITGPIYIGYELSYTDGTSLSVYTNTDGDTDPTTAYERWEDGTWWSFNDGTGSMNTWELDVSLAITANFACAATDPPVADFEADVETACQNSDINFTDLSTNLPDEWLWDFGNSETSDVQNPTYAYPAAGTYTVSLRATNSEGNDTETKTNYITVSIPETPTISANGNDLTASSATSGDYQWYLDGVAIPGATNSTHTAVEDGSYTVVLTDVNGCSEESDAEVISLTAVFDNALSDAITVYPNPVRELLTINFSNTDIQGLSISLLDVAGKTLIKQEDVARQIITMDVSQLSAGVYLLKIRNEGGRIAIKEFVKE